MASCILLISALALLAYPSLNALIFIPGVPVDQLSLLKTQIALNIWELDLINNYGKPTESPLNIKRNTDRVAQYLDNLSQQLSPYNDVVIGNSNGVRGSNNLIIGNRNAVVGSNNYVFSSDFSTLARKTKATATGAMSHTLVSDNWVGELDKKEKILT